MHFLNTCTWHSNTVCASLGNQFHGLFLDTSVFFVVTIFFEQPISRTILETCITFYWCNRCPKAKRMQTNSSLFTSRNLLAAYVAHLVGFPNYVGHKHSIFELQIKHRQLNLYCYKDKYRPPQVISDYTHSFSTRNYSRSLQEKKADVSHMTWIAFKEKMQKLRNHSNVPLEANSHSEFAVLTSWSFPGAPQVAAPFRARFAPETQNRNAARSYKICTCELILLHTVITT